MNTRIVPLVLGALLTIVAGAKAASAQRSDSVAPHVFEVSGDIIVFHGYDGKTGGPSLPISSLTWSNGWPHAALEDFPKPQNK